MLKCVKSGGQTGVDESSLFTAKQFGFLTGGVMPKGFKTLDGPRPDLAKEYNLTEHSSPNYPPRTFQNVRDSDATVRLFKVKESAGEICTLKAIKQYNKLYFDVDFNDPPEPKELAEWLHSFEIVNFAGNSEKTTKGIFKATNIYLSEVFRLYFSHI